MNRTPLKLETAKWRNDVGEFLGELNLQRMINGFWEGTRAAASCRGH